MYDRMGCDVVLCDAHHPLGTTTPPHHIASMPVTSLNTTMDFLSRACTPTVAETCRLINTLLTTAKDASTPASAVTDKTAKSATSAAFKTATATATATATVTVTASTCDHAFFTQLLHDLTHTTSITHTHALIRAAHINTAITYYNMHDYAHARDVFETGACLVWKQRQEDATCDKSKTVTSKKNVTSNTTSTSTAASSSASASTSASTSTSSKPRDKFYTTFLYLAKTCHALQQHTHTLSICTFMLRHIDACEHATVLRMQAQTQMEMMVMQRHACMQTATDTTTDTTTSVECHEDEIVETRITRSSTPTHNDTHTITCTSILDTWDAYMTHATTPIAAWADIYEHGCMIVQMGACDGDAQIQVNIRVHMRGAMTCV